MRSASFAAAWTGTPAPTSDWTDLARPCKSEALSSVQDKEIPSLSLSCSSDSTNRPRGDRTPNRHSRQASLTAAELLPPHNAPLSPTAL